MNRHQEPDQWREVLEVGEQLRRDQGESDDLNGYGLGPDGVPSRP
jgi:hypothetical protein